MSELAQLQPHVLIFPFPAQGHVNSMLKLAELLCLARINITYLVTLNFHDRLLLHTDIKSRFSKYPGFHLKTLPDGIYQGKTNTVDEVMMLYDSLRLVAKPFLRELLSSDQAQSEKSSPITSIIADGILSVALDVAEEMDVPIIYFRTISACGFWAYFCIPQLIDAGEMPFAGKDMDVTIANVTGMERLLRRRDLPSFCRVQDLGSPDFRMVLSETQKSPRAWGLIFNTFEDLEGSTLSHIRKICPNVYTIGPLHAHLKTRIQSPWTSSSNSLWEEDRSCIGWLDQQHSQTVLYVSFGSFTVVTREQLLEFWHGLVNSQVRFLWVIRPDLIPTKNDKERKSTPEELELEEVTKERGYMVGWAPQEDVLSHPAVGGFLTHSGWNSTLESVVEGVPMICWPYFADQQVNSRFVGEVWKLGLDMKDTCDRAIVEKMIRDLMVERKDEFLQRAGEMKKLARKSTEKNGSSFHNLDRLIEGIMTISIGVDHASKSC
uniref:Glycosyltransferase n=1 Tax=Gardenia jasminoides TaxID=114476 RepID=A0A288W8G3_GARJA|nr:UGT63 [Gardenia jasminoides]